ncbi:SpoIIE family protein phosphatase [Streptomyces sp. MS06]|uniref:SpoIIE family protein phosphatase n=1 Tax=Streptomyces sp. MS06 TaxID=3385974 RepID=UPI00399F950E
MTGSAAHHSGAPRRLTELLTQAASASTSAAGGRAAGVYLCSRSSGTLRLAALAGLPGELFKPWWRVHTDRAFPVAEAHRLGAPVVLPNVTEAMRRYPQFAAGLPFPLGCVSVPVATPARSFGALVALRPSVADADELTGARDRLARLADGLAADLGRLSGAGADVVWDGPPMSVRPPEPAAAPERIGRFAWDVPSGRLTADRQLAGLLGLAVDTPPETAEALARGLCAADAGRLPRLLREAAGGGPPRLPVPVRTAGGALLLLDLWVPQDAADAGGAARRVSGLLVDPGAAWAGGGAADPLPEGVFCLDRLGEVRYANPSAARLLGTTTDGLTGRPLWEAVPWLGNAASEDHLRGALLSTEPVHFRVRRPPGDGHRQYGGDWFALSAYPGPSLVTCTVVPANRVAEPPAEAPAQEGVLPEPAEAAPQYRPIVLAIALNEAVTARQVSAVVVQELLPAFGGRRLAIYLLQERHLYLAWETGFPPGFLSRFEGVGLDARLPGVETLTTGRPLFFDSMQQLQGAYPGIPLDATEGARAFLPLIASGRPVGSCILGFDRSRSFSTEERTVLTALAGLIAHAMEKAQRYDTEAALARGLQRALLPRRLSAHPRMETAGRYLPGTEGMDVGGDWYDVVEAGEDGLALVIGDVQGHGVQAAATMGQLRSAVRAFALGDRPPGEVMSGVNHLLIDLDPGQFASCCYVRLDPATGRARAVRAGHPPPLLRHADGRTRVVDLPVGVVLGVESGAHYPVAELYLEPGSVLALYTDGLVERPGSDIDDGITALRLALARSGAPAGRTDGRALADLADRLTASARQAVDRPDDIALLLATRRAEGDGPASPKAR